ncbi:MAG: GDP-mannose 4,6-dehydratase, partial [archaeon]
MLEIALRNCASFLQASTSEVYGDPSVHPQTESYWGNVNPIGIRSCYDEGKRFSEALIMSYSRAKNADTHIARIFNTYGPRMSTGDGRVIPNFVTQALSGKPLTIYGSGKQTRSICYVSDLVAGLILAIDSKERGPINLGNPNEMTMLELAEKIISLCDSKSGIVFEQLPADDPTRRKPDISKAKRVLGWKPGVNSEEGLKRTIEWFKLNPA